MVHVLMHNAKFMHISGKILIPLGVIVMILSGVMMYWGGSDGVSSLEDAQIYEGTDVELELSSLRFLNVVSNNFFTEYQKYIKLEKDFLTRSGIYELYYALLNVHLWSKEYINKTREIIKKYV